MRSSSPKTNNFEMSDERGMEDPVGGLSSMPTTPVQKTPIRGSNNEEAVTSVVLMRSATRLKVHPHGLSAKKKLEECESVQGSLEVPVVVEQWKDRSLDCVRRGEEEGKQNALERIDINRMFSTSQENVEGVEEPTIRMNRSPLRLDMSSPIKTNTIDDEGPQPKRLKLELECVPSLPQPDDEKDGANELVGSPEVIEMIDTKSSPMREFSHAECEEHRNEGFDGTPRRRISSLHTLTPIRKNTDEIYNLSDGAELGEGYHMITSRNEELVKQVHVLNQKLNKMMTSCDVAFFHYKKMKADYETLSVDCEQKLNKSYEEVLALIKERDRFKERANKLKTRIDESTDEFHMLKQNQSILQGKYETLINESETSKQRETELGVECSSLKGEVARCSKERQLLDEELKNVSTQLHDVTTRNTMLEDHNEKLREEISDLKERLTTKNGELERLQKQLDETISAGKGANDEVLAELNEVIAQRANLEAELEALRVASEADGNKLRDQLHEAVTRSNLMVLEVQELKDHSDGLQAGLNARVSEIEQMSKKIEELNDDAEIGKAEIKELQEDKLELERTNACLESSIAELEDSVRNWQAKYHEQEEKDKISLELESIQLKNNNIEAEHLAELEQLHSNLSSLQDALKENSDVITDLKNLNEKLREDNKAFEKKYQEALKNESRESDLRLVEALKKEVIAWKEKYQLKEQESNKSLKLLAEDLYIQYSSKHEQKVKLLKKGYETKFQSKLDKITLQNEGLTQEIDLLKNQLASERKEKQKLLEVLESRKS